MVENVISAVEFEIGQIDQLLKAYADLLKRVQKEPPDLVEVTAVGSVLHSFYNGLENIFLLIVKEIDQDVPTGSHWHRNLLTQMTKLTPNRGTVLKAETMARLADYLAFRHFYRHSYSLFLNWNELEKLVIPLPEVWAQVKADVRLFLNDLDSDNTN